MAAEEAEAVDERVARKRCGKKCRPPRALRESGYCTSGVGAGVTAGLPAAGGSVPGTAGVISGSAGVTSVWAVWVSGGVSSGSSRVREVQPNSAERASDRASAPGTTE
jgi:hypothetical protein